MALIAKFSLFLAVVLVFTTLDMWLALRGVLPIKPTVTIALLLILTACLMSFRPNKNKITFFDVIEHTWIFYLFFFIFSLYSIATVVFLTSMNSVNITYSSLYFYALIIILFSIFVTNHNYKEVRNYIGIALIILCASVFVDVFNPGYFANYQQRASGFAENGTRAALAVNFALIGALNYERYSRIDLVYIFVAGCAIVSIMSRTGVYIFLSTICLFILHNRVTFTRFFFYGILGLLFLALIVQLFIAFLLDGTVFDLAGGKVLRILTIESMTDFSGRYSLWQVYIPLIDENLFFGKGAGYIDSLAIDGAHNFFIHTLVESGIIGFSLVMISFVALGVYSLMVRGQMLAVYAGFFILSMGHSTPLYERPIIFMIALGLVTAYRSRYFDAEKVKSN